MDQVRLTRRNFFILSKQILQAANQGSPRVHFLKALSGQMVNAYHCEVVLIWLDEGAGYRCAKKMESGPGGFDFQVIHLTDFQIEASPAEIFGPGLANPSGMSAPPPAFTSTYGSFWTNNGPYVSGRPENPPGLDFMIQAAGREYQSIAWIPFKLGGDTPGIIQMAGRRQELFTADVIAFFEDIAEILGIAFLNWRNTWTLQERVKEISCLYGIAQLLDSSEKDLDSLLQSVLKLIPPAWLYADIASARITFDERSHAMPDFTERRPVLKSDLWINGENRGAIEVTYTKDKPSLDEGPFLREERTLLDTISRELALIIEGRLYEEQHAEIMDQLRHADRLSMMGQLAASVAHEINEPLTSILGYAQLAQKCPDLPEQAASDIEKIVGTSLHTREIVKKFLTFAHKMPTRESAVDLNEVIREALSFFEYRWAREHIDIELAMDQTMPPLEADAARLRQVVTNLVVNAIQAMPGGGKLSIRTFQSEGEIGFSVQDTGGGMTEEIKEKIFIPFYTTKPAGQGTGLGLPVAREIVASHGGTIRVFSHPGGGARIDVRLPKIRT